MYGKSVKVDLGEDIIIEIFVSCNPDAIEEEL